MKNPTLSELLDAADFDGLAIDKQPTGYTASVLTAEGWSDRVFAGSASGAVEKVLKLHRPVSTLAPPPY